MLNNNCGTFLCSNILAHKYIKSQILVLRNFGTSGPIKHASASYKSSLLTWEWFYKASIHSLTGISVIFLNYLALF